MKSAGWSTGTTGIRSTGQTVVAAEERGSRRGARQDVVRRAAVCAGAVLLALAGCTEPGGSAAQTPAPGDASPVTPSATSPAAEVCAPFTPQVLPSGADPGEARPFPDDEPHESFLAWGEERDQVVLAWGWDAIEMTGISEHRPRDWPDELIVGKDGNVRYVVPIGDPPIGQISIRFSLADCPYVLWLPGTEFDGDGEVVFYGYSNDEAVDYARRF